MGPDATSRSSVSTERYASWINRHHRAVVIASVAVAVLAGSIAAQLPVYADFSYLLPPSAVSVQHLRALEKRARVLGTVMLAVKSSNPTERAAAAQLLRDRLIRLGPEVASSITFDDSVARKFAWDNRWLFVPLDDLEAAKTALATEINAAKLAANPLYVDFESDPAPAGTTEKPAADADVMRSLRQRLHDAETKKNDPGDLVSKDGTVQMMILRTAFASGDVDKGGELLRAVSGVAAQVRAERPNVEIGVAGDVLTTELEHHAILHGMVFSTLVTVLLVVGALLLYYRSVAAVGALSWSLAVGTLLTFMFTRLSIGHLNVATAFLSSIVVGNGINFGIMLLARHVEERRAGQNGATALGRAIGGTLRGTLAAALTASVAYLSLVVTDFRGFRHFGIIGGMGMVLCWLCAYTVLPACLALAEARGWVKVYPEPGIGPLLARLLPKRLGVVVTLSLALTAVAAGITWYYLAHDPYEANFRNLRSESAELNEERRWMHEIDLAFGQGISGGFVIGVPTRDEAAPLVARLRALDEGKGRNDRLFSRINTLDDALPADQEKKLRVLDEIRDMLSDETLATLSAADRADALALRPPATLRALKDNDVPDGLAWPFIEADGSRGKLVLAMSGWGYEIWDAHDLVRFADNVRALDLGEHTLLGGSAFVFSDMLRLIERDGPRATLAAALGAVLVIFLVVGFRRHGMVTIACGAAGTLLMMATGALVGLRINFLDFVALPITIGIGIDYAVNICAREKLEGHGGARRALATAGGAVLLSSYTTIVGYGSLLVSSNKGIQSFGSAAILGEITCLLAALLLAPALLTVFGAPQGSDPETTLDADASRDALPAVE